MKALAAVLLAMSLAGCQQPAPVDNPSAVPQPASPVPEFASIVFFSCDEQTAALAIARAAADSMLPAGWVPTPATGDASGSTATLYSINYRCPFAVDNVSGPEAGVAFLGLPVTPPDGYVRADAAVHMFALWTRSDDVQVVDAFLAQGAGVVEPGDVSLALPVQQPAVRSGRMDASGAYVLETTVQGDPANPLGSGAVIRLFASDGRPLDGNPGNVTRAIDLSYPAGNRYAGEGRAQFDSWLAGPLGVPDGRASGLGVHWWGDGYDLSYRVNATYSAAGP